MIKITPDMPELQSMNITDDNISKLNALFPEAFNEGRIDFDVLKQLLGGNVSDKEERYGLNWHGKRQARQLALTPSRGTLRPCKADSVDWDTTRNLMIEGDNLEVLKLLQKSYAGKVKLIYIDPPYNKGKDFVYSDNYSDNITNYLAFTGQIASGLKISTNTEASGRFHSKWLDMIFPRLKLARNLLTDNGLIFISIDDDEYVNLKLVCDDVFGEQNYVATFIWQKKKGGGNDAKYCAIEHEYIILYAKNKSSLPNMFEGFTEEYAKRYKESDSEGRFFWDTFKRKSGKQYYAITCPDGTVLKNDEFGNPISWLRSETTFKQNVAHGDAKFEKRETGWSVLVKQRMPEGKKPRSLILDKGTTSSGADDAFKLFDQNIFDNPKPVSLIQYIIAMHLKEGGIILDFFAGSGTTAHALIKQNAEDAKKRHFILVQIPEPISEKKSEQKAACDFCRKINKPTNISELTKERLRRAGKKVREDNPDWDGDVGFRVFKLDTSNIRPWQANAETLSDQLDASVSPILDDRSEDDLLTELMLKRGIDLSVRVETRQFEGMTVSCAENGKLFTCFAQHIPVSGVEALAQGIADWHKACNAGRDSVCYFLDDAFENNVAKTNLCAILAQQGLTNLHSL